MEADGGAMKVALNSTARGSTQQRKSGVYTAFVGS
jgi:hypothetical protein